jgi:hypothetical protein
MCGDLDSASGGQVRKAQTINIDVEQVPDWICERRSVTMRLDVVQTYLFEMKASTM